MDCGCVLIVKHQALAFLLLSLDSTSLITPQRARFGFPRWLKCHKPSDHACRHSWSIGPICQPLWHRWKALHSLFPSEVQPSSLFGENPRWHLKHKNPLLRLNKLFLGLRRHLGFSYLGHDRLLRCAESASSRASCSTGVSTSWY